MSAEDSPVADDADRDEVTREAPPTGMTRRDRPAPIVAASRASDRHRKIYLTPASKYAIALSFALMWAGLSVWIGRYWAEDIGQYVSLVGGWIVVFLVAIIPGFVVALMGMSLALDRQPPFRIQQPTVPVTVIVAAYNEEVGIRATIERIAIHDYLGDVRIIVANNNSSDRTVERAYAAAEEFDVDVTVIDEPTPGKSHALNTALESVETEYVLTVDADTLLHPEAIRRLMARLLTGPDHVVAVAGAVLVRNSRENLMTKMQEWDYWLGIAAVKRMQGLYSATLVAQGAFSVYETEAVRAIGGWPDAIGEDIVVTWRLMMGGSRVLYEPTAVAFTDAPEKVSHFMKQRARWARGMFEGIREVPPWKQSKGLAKLVASIDLLIPFLDVGYALLWLPGVVLFLFGYPILVSLWTLLVFPITLLMYGMIRHFQSSRVFGPLGLKVRRNRIGYIAFLLLYQALCSTASLVGYAQFVFNRERTWK